MNEARDDTVDMRALQQGDTAALDRLMARWQLRLRTYLLRHELPQEDALDLAQETFVRVFRHRDRFDPQRRFSTWMFQIALNLVRDHVRRSGRRPTAPIEDAPEAATTSTPRANTEREEIAAAVRHAIGTLPETLRDVVILREYEHLSHAEIADILETSPKAVETRLHRARDQLRHRLQRWMSR